MLYTVHIKLIITKFCFCFALKYSSVERYVLKCFVTSIRRQSSEERTFFRQSFTPVAVVRHCIRRQCFILLPNVWVVFKIYFAILHKIVAVNNVQHSIKQAKGKKISFRTFALHLVSHVTHPGHLLLAHGCMEETF